MIFLLLSIVFTSSLIILFKYFERFKVDVLPTIVVNYFTAGTMGFIHTGGLPETGIAQEPWLVIALPLGVLFISVFYTIALTTQKLGVSAATVANKMSLIIPVIAAFYLYDDSVTVFKVSGIVLALAAVYFTTKKENTGDPGKHSRLFIFPAIVFVGSGIVDSLVNYAQKIHLQQEVSGLFLSTAFYSAGLTGVCVLIYRYFSAKRRITRKSVLAGICLGIPNYFSIYFLIEALNKGNLESSLVYPLNNIGIVVVSALYSFFMFRENLSLINKLGIFLAILSIVLMNYS